MQKFTDRQWFGYDLTDRHENKLNEGDHVIVYINNEYSCEGKIIKTKFNNEEGKVHTRLMIANSLLYLTPHTAGKTPHTAFTIEKVI